MRANALAFVLAGVVTASAALPAQSKDERRAVVGMRARVDQVVLPGSELTPAPSSLKTPIVVRVLAVWPHGEHRRYDFEWTGLEPGKHDLTKYLVRKDGTSTDGLPPLEVEATSVLAKDAREPSELDPIAPDRVGGYRTMQWVAGVLWAAGLLAILFVGRRFRRQRVVEAPKPTLADRLRPLVERVASGDADNAAKAELERLLVAFWRSRLSLQDRKAADAIVAIKAHAEAGLLLRQLEAWLHMPEPPNPVDLHAVLEPYRAVTAESFEPATAGRTS
ncbi:MAG: hypothetical protein WAT39_08815 [Planctomycetota bacterium]